MQKQKITVNVSINPLKRTKYSTDQLYLYLEKKGMQQFTIRVPNRLHRKLMKDASKHGVRRASWVSNLLATYYE